MIKEIQYTNIRRVLDELHRHPLLQDLTIDQAVSYLITFIGIFGLPNLYLDKETILHVDNFRAKLPCDLVSINQIMECKTGTCLRSMTDTFLPEESYLRTNNSRAPQELAFKVQGMVLITSFKDGDVKLSYKAIPIDDEGFPQLIDNPVFIEALRAYIKKEQFVILFDQGKISQQALQNAQQQYAWLAGQLQSEFTIPSVSEMETITRLWNTLIPKVSEFNRGFHSLGNKEYLRLK